MNALEVIGKKRDGGEHTAAEIEFLLGGYVRGDVPDYQIAAWLMAVCIRGMTAAETLALQRAETDALLAPWRRIWRWARHPLVVATLEWYLRQRRARRQRRS